MWPDESTRLGEASFAVGERGLTRFKNSIDDVWSFGMKGR